MLRQTAIFSALLIGFITLANPAAIAAADPGLEIFRSLPASEVVITLDAATLVNKTLPAWLSDKPDTLKRFNDNIARVQTEAGIDPRRIDRVALAVTKATETETEAVAVFEGNFQALTQSAGMDRAVAAFKASFPRFDVRTETYQGLTVYVMPEKNGGPEAKPSLAMVLLDARMLAIGTPSAVHGVVDARKNKVANAAANAALVEAYKQTPATSALRLAALVPKPLLDSMIATDPGNPFLKSLATVRYAFGQADLSSTELTVKLTTRSGTPSQGGTMKMTFDAGLGILESLTQNRPDLAAMLAYITTAGAGTDASLNIAIPSEKVGEVWRVAGGR